MNVTGAEAQHRNNYKGQIYFSPPNISIQKKIDLITLTQVCHADPIFWQKQAIVDPYVYITI